MIFAAGLGKRLRPLTNRQPKCLIEISGITILEHVIDRLKAAGVRAVMINLHHLPDKIRKFVVKKNNFGIDVQFSYEKELLDTGGGLKKVSDFFYNENEFFVYNGDIFSLIDLEIMLRYHRDRSPVATLAVSTRETTRYLYFDKSMQLTGWENRSTGETITWNKGAKSPSLKLAFNGIHILSTKVFDLMRSEKKKFPIIPFYLKIARNANPVIGFPMDEFIWADVGTRSKLKALKDRIEG